jgi:type II pantothenate kinase
MEMILGVDVGSSTTKIVAMNSEKKVVASLKVSASDQRTSLFGAIGRLLYEADLTVADVRKIMLTGVGASYVEGNIYGIPTEKVTEFEALGTGGLYLSGMEKAIVGSIGTGTVFVSASGHEIKHVGGSAVGGGTLVGLCSRLFGVKDVDIISDMADHGNLTNVDWGISEVSNEEMPSLPTYATASNLGKMASCATDNDVALGILNMIFQTAGTLAVFACRDTNLKDAVITGTLATMEHAKILLGMVGELYGIHFIIPKEAAYATAIGAALLGLE